MVLYAKLITWKILFSLHGSKDAIVNALIRYNEQNILVDFSSGYDVSIPIRRNENVKAYYLPNPSFEPFKTGAFVGSVALGGSVNCENILFNAHGNGTHTECRRHVANENIFMARPNMQYHSFCRLISVVPVAKPNGDRVIDLSCLEVPTDVGAIAIRTLPNGAEKMDADYSGTNPVYFDDKLLLNIKESGIKHLLTDLPSVDREEDEGKLIGHKAFFGDQTNDFQTITEFIYVPDSVQDGFYFLNLQVAAFESDAAPSRPVLYPVTLQ